MTALPHTDVYEAASDIVAVIHRAQLRYATEAELQEGVAFALTAAGFVVRREVPLTARDRIDLLVGRIGVEVKIAGMPRNVDRQLLRYAQSDLVDALLLVTNRARHRPPTTLNGKPVLVASLLRAGL